ncbi:hypothetical protein P8452_31754 [Trifolium repens]|nr:hypothetical protein P8452_31754 [Trifolium repens]
MEAGLFAYDRSCGEPTQTNVAERCLASMTAWLKHAPPRAPLATPHKIYALLATRPLKLGIFTVTARLLRILKLRIVYWRYRKVVGQCSC